MKAYRFGEYTPCYQLVIEEDDNTIKVAFVTPKSIVEHIATPVKSKLGFVRLVYGSGSSMPYKDENGNLYERYRKINI